MCTVRAFHALSPILLSEACFACAVVVLAREIHAFLAAMAAQRSRGRLDSIFLIQECPVPSDVARETGIDQTASVQPSTPSAVLQALVRRRPARRGALPL